MDNEKTVVGVIVMGSVTSDDKKKKDVEKIFQPEVQTVFKGLTDGFTYDEIRENFWPEDGQSYIVTQMEGKKDIKISEENAHKLVELRVRELEEHEINNFLVLCTGSFEKIATKGIFFIPERAIFGMLEGLKVKKVGIIVPEELQITDAMDQYKKFNPVIKAASPYGSIEKLEKTAAEFACEDVDILVSDCMGFTEEMGQIIKNASHKNVVVPRILVPNIMKSFIR